MGSMATIATGTTSAFWLQRRLWGLVEPMLSPVGLPILLTEEHHLQALSAAHWLHMH